MLEILTLMAPIGLLIATGIGFVRFGLFPAEGLPVMNRFVMNACIPVLLFAAVTRGAGPGGFAWTQVFVYAAASLLSSSILALVLRYGLGEPLAPAIVLALGGGSANTVFLGYPIASAVIPDRATEVFGWIVMAEILFVVPIVTTLALMVGETGGRLRLRDALRPFLLSPVTIGLYAGLAFLATGLSLPGPVAEVVGSITAAAPFLALFLIGGTLTQVQLSRTGPRVMAITFGKLVLHPLIIALAFAAVFGWNSEVQRDAVLFAAIPIFTSYVVFCGRHGVGEVAASAIVLTTAVGAVTVTLLLGVLF